MVIQCTTFFKISCSVNVLEELGPYGVLLLGHREYRFFARFIRVQCITAMLVILMGSAHSQRSNVFLHYLLAHFEYCAVSRVKITNTATNAFDIQGTITTLSICINRAA